MATPAEILQYLNSLSPDQRAQALESGAVERAIQSGSIQPLEQYSPAPPPPTSQIPESAIITARPHGGSYGTYREGGVAQTEALNLFVSLQTSS